MRLRVTNEAIVTLIDDGFLHVEEASLFGMFELDVVYERDSLISAGKLLNLSTRKQLDEHLGHFWVPEWRFLLRIRIADWNVTTSLEICGTKSISCRHVSN